MMNLYENTIERCCRIHRSARRPFVRHNPAGNLATLNEYAYLYDDIGNRLSSLDLGTNRTYTANALNQYTLVGRDDPIAPQEEFSPKYDLDGYSRPESAPYQMQHSAHSAPPRLCVEKLEFRAEGRP